MSKETLAALAVAALLSAAPASAAQIALRADPQAPEAAIVASTYRDFIKSRPDMRVETAMIDLQGRGVASIVARFVSRDTCGAGDRCGTVVLRHGPQGWQPVFEHSAKSLATAPAVNLPAADGMASLVVDGGPRWVWAGFDRYRPELASLGTVFPPDPNIRGRAPAPASLQTSQASSEVARVARTAMASMLTGVPESAMQFYQTPVALETGAPAAVPALWVRAQGAGVCANGVGCPHTLLARSGNGYRALWSGMAAGRGAAGQESSRNMRDVFLGTPRGYLKLRFDGTAYRAVETSYPSDITPAP